MAVALGNTGTNLTSLRSGTPGSVGIPEMPTMPGGGSCASSKP